MNELEDIFQAVAERVGPAVVRIGRGRGRGAGVVIGEGRIVTNAHNVRGPETTVRFSDGSTGTVPVLGSDLDWDLALLDAGEGAPTPVSWEPAAQAPAGLGQLVLTVTGAGEQGSRVTAGYVSAVGRAFRGPRGRRISGGFEHTAPLVPGSSGGPVVDSTGRLLGIDTHRLGEGFYLALPADAELATRLDQLATGSGPRRVRLGVGVAPAEAARRMRAAVGLPERDGVLVRVVEDDSPAARAGIQRGDLISRLGDHDLRTADDLFDALAAVGEDSAVQVAVVRGTEDLVLTVDLSAPATD